MITTEKNITSFIPTLCIFNILLLAGALMEKSLAAGGVASDFKMLQYLFTYRFEFLKRGFVGTIFDLLSIAPTKKFLFVFSVVCSNAIFLLMSNLFIKASESSSKKAFIWVLFLFALSPAAAWNLGYEFGRADILNLVIELIAITLVISKWKQAVLLIPLLIAVGILNHEAFIFLNFPIILTIILNELGNEIIKRTAVFSSIVVAIVIGCSVMLFGNVTPQNVGILYSSVYHRPLPAQLPMVNPFMIVTTNLETNVKYNMVQYLTFFSRSHYFAVFPLVGVYVYLYSRILDFQSLSKEKKLVFISPFLIFPMFLVSWDTYRWISIMIINMFVSFAYLCFRSSNQIEFKGIRHLKLSLVILLLYAFVGPAGAYDSLPYFSTILRKVFHIL